MYSTQNYHCAGDQSIATLAAIRKLLVSFNEWYNGFLELQSRPWRHLKNTEPELSVKRTGLMKVKMGMATREIAEVKHTQAAGEYMWDRCTKFTAQSRNTHLWQTFR